MSTDLDTPSRHFSRFGDGEWYCIFRGKGHNCDGSRYELPGLDDDMRAAAISPPPLVTRALPDWIRAKSSIMRKARMICPDVDKWPRADGFCEAAKRNEHWELLERGRVCLVGAKHLGVLAQERGLPHIVTPGQDAYHDRVRVMKEMWELRREVDTFLLSCGFLANVAIHHLSEPLGPEVALLDVGSIWDPWCGGELWRPWHLATARKYGLPHKAVRGKSSPPRKKTRKRC